jgi:hypothetical protein
LQFLTGTKEGSHTEGDSETKLKTKLVIQVNTEVYKPSSEDLNLSKRRIKHITVKPCFILLDLRFSWQ